jgi:uncharacterized membrane protein YfcA
VDWILLLSLIFILAAFFVKGFSGFGPALIIVPSFTLLFNPLTAISLSSLFDAIAGIILLITVFKSVNWKFIFPTAFFLVIGAYAGVSLLGVISVNVLKILIVIVVCVFIYILISEKSLDLAFVKNRGNAFLFGLAAITGIFTGLTGTGGPILVIYIKLKNKKDEFRSQIIAIFTLGAVWRLFLYKYNGFLPEFEFETFIMILFVVLGLSIGHFLQRNVNEQRFNRYVAFILIIPVVTLLFEVLI